MTFMDEVSLGLRCIAALLPCCLAALLLCCLAALLPLIAVPYTLAPVQLDACHITNVAIMTYAQILRAICNRKYVASFVRTSQKGPRMCAFVNDVSYNDMQVPFTVVFVLCHVMSSQQRSCDKCKYLTAH